LERAFRDLSSLFAYFLAFDIPANSVEYINKFFGNGRCCIHYLLEAILLFDKGHVLVTRWCCRPGGERPDQFLLRDRQEEGCDWIWCYTRAADIIIAGAN